MTDNPDYIERTILQLRREYGKDELVAALIKQVSEREIEIGKLKAEIDEANDKVEKIRARLISERKKKIDIAAEKEIKKDELYVKLEKKYLAKIEENNALRKRNVELFKTNKDIISAYNTLDRKLTELKKLKQPQND
jgi:Asp-tRNA(Asn)/Glu-tRNA(Gln) amidotransferase B subunit